MKVRTLLVIAVLLAWSSAMPTMAWPGRASAKSSRKIWVPMLKVGTIWSRSRQLQLANGAERWVDMSPEQRERAQQRFKEWRNLTDAQRDQIRDRYRDFQNLPPEQKRRIRNNFQRFKDMSPERRQRLRERFRDLTPEQRKRVRDRLTDRRPRPPAPRD